MTKRRKRIAMTKRRKRIVRRRRERNLEVKSMQRRTGEYLGPLVRERTQVFHQSIQGWSFAFPTQSSQVQRPALWLVNSCLRNLRTWHISPVRLQNLSLNLLQHLYL